MAEPRNYAYVALDANGRQIRGVTTAGDEREAFERLRREGLSPLTLKVRARAKTAARNTHRISEQDEVMLLSNLGSLLRAGADMRTALGILGARSKPHVAAACQGLSAEISGGGALDIAFGNHFRRNRDLVAAMVAAGEASGDLAGTLSRSAEIIEARLQLRSRLIALLSYPAFVFASTILAVLALLLFVLPTLAPLAAASGSPPATLAALLWVSEQLTTHLAVVGGAVAVLLVAVLAAQVSGLLSRLTDAAVQRGPFKKLASGMTFGGFANALGSMLAAGAPMSEALRLAIRSVGSPIARSRLEPVLQAVRQGQSLSSALEDVPDFPSAVAQLAIVGEATGRLGELLVRGGRLEESAGLKRIETIGQIAAPALIVSLGGLVGLLMAGLLSGVSQLGEAALQ